MAGPALADPPGPKPETGQAPRRRAALTPAWALKFANFITVPRKCRIDPTISQSERPLSRISPQDYSSGNGSASHAPETCGSVPSGCCDPWFCCSACFHCLRCSRTALPLRRSNRSRCPSHRRRTEHCAHAKRCSRARSGIKSRRRLRQPVGRSKRPAANDDLLASDPAFRDDAGQLGSRPPPRHPGEPGRGRGAQRKQHRYQAVGQSPSHLHAPSFRWTDRSTEKLNRGCRSDDPRESSPRHGTAGRPARYIVIVKSTGRGFA
jgi:hypothetical protein